MMSITTLTFGIELRSMSGHFAFGQNIHG